MEPLEDWMATTCPYCDAADQTVGETCTECSRTVPHLPDWARVRRRTWLSAWLTRKRITWTVVVALLIVFVIWLNFPFAPDPVILLRGIDSDATAQARPGLWPVAGRDLRHTRNVAAATPLRGEIAWTAHIPEPLLSEPVAANGNIYMGSADGIFALSESDGSMLPGWDSATPGRVTGAAATVGSDLFFGSTDHSVNAWDANSGGARWTFPTRDTVELAPVVSEGLVHIGSGLRWLYALDASNGNPIWQAQLDADASASVSIHDGKLFVGDDDGTFYILSARTGQELFRYRALKTIAGSPVISADGERAYFASSGQVYAVNAKRREIPGQFQFKKIWAQLYLWQVPGVPRPPGQQGGLWRFSPSDTVRGIYSSPALADENGTPTLYASGHDRQLYALDAVSGDQQWLFPAEDPIHASPLIMGDDLIFGDAAGTLYSINRHNGSPNWTLELGSAVSIPPVLGSQHLIVRTADGGIHAIR